MNISYIWFTESGKIEAGVLQADSKELAATKIKEIVKEITDEPYGCIMSSERKFHEEINEYEDPKNFIDELTLEMMSKAKTKQSGDEEI